MDSVTFDGDQDLVGVDLSIIGSGCNSRHWCAASGVQLFYYNF
jgi:hypothetical protein